MLPEAVQRIGFNISQLQNQSLKFHFQFQCMSTDHSTQQGFRMMTATILAATRNIMVRIGFIAYEVMRN